MPSVHPNSLECTHNVRARTRSAVRRRWNCETISDPRHTRTQDPVASTGRETNPTTPRPGAHCTTALHPGDLHPRHERTQEPLTSPAKRTQAESRSRRNEPELSPLLTETNPGDRPTMRMHDTGVPVSDSPRLPIRCPDDRMRTVPGHDPSSRIRCPRKKPGPRARLSQSGRQNVWERKRGSPSARGGRHCTGRDARLTMAVPTSMTAQNHDHAATHNK